MKTNQDARNPKKRKPGRSTTQNKNTKSHTHTDWSTDRPTFDESLARSIALQVTESEESPPAIGDGRIGVQ
jgi:hypothetical protein